MSQNFEVGVKITADGKVLVGETRSAKDALNQLGETAKRTNTESAAAAERFTANLKRQADTLGMTASQMRAYDAAQMDLNEAQRASVEASNRAITSYESQQVALDEMKTRAVAAGAVIGTALVAGFKQSITVAAQAEQSHLRLAAVIRGTGHAAGLTKADLDGMAEGMKEKLGIDDDALRDSMAVLLTFRNVSRDSFEEALEVSADLAAVMQSDLKSAVLQLGKALENPEEGLTALKRSGVSFSETQKDMIKDLVETGDQAQAITLILKTMKEQGLDSVAESMNEGLTKSTRDAGMAWDDLLKTIGGTETVKGAVDVVLGSWTGYLKDMRQVIESGDWLDRLAFFTIGLKTPDMIVKSNAPAVVPDDPQARAIAEAGLARQKEAQQAEIAAIAKKKAGEEAAKAAEEASKRAIAAAKKAADERAREAQRAVESAEKTIAAFKRETQEIGLNAIQKKMLAAATEAANAPTEELRREIMASAAAWAMATQREEENLAIKKQQADAADELARRERQAAEQTQRYWSNIWGDVEQTARMAFVQFAAHGKSAMESIGESIKVAIIDVLYQLTIRKWIINIGASFGLGGSGMAMAGDMGGGGLLGNALSLGSMGTNLASMFKGGFGGASLVRSGLGAIGGSFGAGASGAFSAGAFGPAGLSYLGGAGTSIGGSAIGSTGTAAATAAEFGGMATMGASMAAMAGPAIALVAVDMIGRLLAGDKKLGGAEHIPVLGGFLAAMFGRGPYKFRQQSLQGEFSADGFDGSITDVYRSKGGWFMGNKHKSVESDLPRDMQLLFDDAIGGFYSGARDFAKNMGLEADLVEKYTQEIQIKSEKKQRLTQEQITKMIDDFGNSLATHVLPNVDALRKLGEDAFDALGRMNTEYLTLVNAATLILGKSAADARAMISGSTFEGRTAFVDNAGGIEALNQKSNDFAANFLTAEERLGISSAALNAELNNLGLSTDLTREQFKSLVQSFGQVGGVSEEMLQSLLNLQYKFIDVRNAQDQLAAAEKTRTDQLLKTNINIAFGALQRAVDAERKSVETHIDNIGKSLDKLKTLSGALQNTLGRMQSAGDAGEQRAAAQAQIAAALAIARSGGALPDAASLQRSLDVVAQPSEELYSSFTDYMRDFARTAADINSLDGMAQDQIKNQESALEIEKAQLTSLDGILKTAQDQIDALNGIDNSIMSLAQALQGFNAAAGAVKNSNAVILPTGSASSGASVGPSPISDAQIREYFASSHTPAEIAKDAISNDISSARIAQVMGFEQNQVQRFFNANPDIPKFGYGGFHVGGWRVVGDRGPELEYTPPSQIFSNSQSQRLLDLSEVVAELKQLRAELAEVRKSTRQTADLLDDVSAGGGAFLVETA